MTTVTTAGWGNYPVVNCERHKARARADLVHFAHDGKDKLPQGNCRSYGDACLSPAVVSTLDLNRLLSFDRDTGVLHAEAGVTIEKILRFALPLGWFPPVTPGTKHPTLGGCVAADVHGKNHHRDGSLSSFVDELEMVLADGSIVHCSRVCEPDLFWATFGGMGLTGFVYSVTLRLRSVSSAFLRMRTIKAHNLAETCRVLVETQDAYRYSVAWVDCLSRCWGQSIVTLGEHAEVDDLPDRPFRLHSTPRITIPMGMPGLAVSRQFVKMFNAIYFRRQWRRQTDKTIHYDPFFYPLDGVSNWNRAYGPRGFVQYQLAIPFADSDQVLAQFLTSLRKHGHSSTLAVLKTFGPQLGGPLAFPMEGFTLALDIPVGDGSVVSVLQDLTALVLQANGRVYLAKDAVLSKDDFQQMYPRLDEFLRIKKQFDPKCQLRSLQSDRIGLT